MAAATDCALAALGERRDGDVVTRRRDHQPDQAPAHQEGRPDDVRDARRPRRVGRARRVRQDARGVQGRARRTTRSCSVRGRVDHKDQARTCLIVQKVDALRADRRGARARAATGGEGVGAGRRGAADPARRGRSAGDGARRAEGRAGGLPGRVGRRDRAVHARGRAPPAARSRLPRLARGAGLHAELEALLGAAILAPAASARRPPPARPCARRSSP